MAFLVWANDNDSKWPWLVNAADGGLNNLNGGSPISANPYIHFAWVSNELVTPAVLICPSDKAKLSKGATDFGKNINGGFQHINYQNNAVSFFVGLDANYAKAPESMLTGDRNINVSRNKTCGTVGVPATAVDGLDSNVGFTNGIHRLSGNVGLADGSTQQGSGQMLRQLALASGDDIDNAAIGGPAPNNDILVPGQPTVIP